MYNTLYSFPSIQWEKFQWVLYKKITDAELTVQIKQKCVELTGSYNDNTTISRI